MCGICGIVAFDRARPIDPALLAQMTDSLAHRGPDAEGTWVDGHAGLGFRRLSILDLSPRGNQPFTNETGDIHLVCNGEIYNAPALRQALVQAGHRFVSQSDCETALHAYEEYGLEFVHRLDGMFALAIVDTTCQRLVLVRDRLGIKPLYYRVATHDLRFGSELKAILQDPGVPRVIDPLAVNLYLTRHVIPAPYTIYRGIAKLLPGEMLVADLPAGLGGVSRYRYWQPGFEPKEGWTESRFVEALAAQLSDSVRSHLASDVPMGVLLSGGLDSSAVLANARRLSPTPLTAFTIGFNDADHDELGLAQELASAWGVGHHARVLPALDAVALLPQLVRCHDEPFGDTSSVPTFLVSALASQHVKVVLSGDGGDELFGGYISAGAAARLQAAGHLPEALRRHAAGWLARLWPGTPLRKLQLPSWLLMASLRDHLFEPTVRNAIQPEFRVPDEALLATYDWLRPQLEPLSPVNAYFAGLTAQYLQDDILTKMDRASSAHGLEVRVPLLDHHFVSLAASVPPALRFKGGQPKHIFREAVRREVPAHVLAHPKRGFGMPPSYQRRAAWQAELETLRREQPLLDTMVDLRSAATWDGLLTWRVLFLGHWLRQHAETPRGATAPAADQAGRSG